MLAQLGQNINIWDDGEGGDADADEIRRDEFVFFVNHVDSVYSVSAEVVAFGFTQPFQWSFVLFRFRAGLLPRTFFLLFSS